jgi:lipoprotein-anchoring transpeptidase ErfK/SrfK
MRIVSFHFALGVVALLVLLGGSSASAQIFGSKGPGAPAKAPKVKTSSLISRQPPAKVDRSIEASINPDNSYVIVSLSKQRAYVKTGTLVYIDTPISSGKPGHSTPTGSFRVMEKDPDHRSSIYGDFVDRSGRTVRSGISSKIDSAPSGTHYLGASMKWFCRLTDTGVGMHVGILPGYAASHGCIRLPADIAPLIYQKVKTGTPVTVEE